ncbi:ParB family protein [Microbacterium sp. NPDC055683]
MATTARRSIRDRNKAAITHDVEAPPAPAVAPEPASVDTPAEPAPAEPPARPRSSSTSTTKPAASKYPPKVSFYQDRADTDRVRGAILHTMATERYRNLSQFINEAVMEKVERLEKKYNGGNPFPPVTARELPQGRPMGE